MTRVLGVEIFEENHSSFKSVIIKALLGPGQVKVGKINSEFLNRALYDEHFANTLEHFDVNIADGRGVLWAAKYLSIPITKIKIIRNIQAIWQVLYSGLLIIISPGFITKPIREAIPGVEALNLMIQSASETNSGTFFFGANQQDGEKAIKKLKEENPNLIVSGYLNGYDWQDDKSIDPVALINKTEAAMLVVALGSPLQEYWIDENLSKLKKVKVAVGEGGSLAFLAGTFKRAPKWVNRIGLEWLWRLFLNRSLTHQTGSRFKRVWNAVPEFIFKVLKWKLKNE